MNDTDRELAAVKERMITLERRIAALEKQLAGVDSQAAFEQKHLKLVRKQTLHGAVLSIGLLLLVILLLLIIEIVGRIT